MSCKYCIKCLHTRLACTIFLRKKINCCQHTPCSLERLRCLHCQTEFDADTIMAKVSEMELNVTQTRSFIDILTSLLERAKKAADNGAPITSLDGGPPAAQPADEAATADGAAVNRAGTAAPLNLPQGPTKDYKKEQCLQALPILIRHVCSEVWLKSLVHDHLSTLSANENRPKLLAVGNLKELADLFRVSGYLKGTKLQQLQDWESNNQRRKRRQTASNRGASGGSTGGPPDGAAGASTGGQAACNAQVRKCMAYSSTVDGPLLLFFCFTLPVLVVKS